MYHDLLSIMSPSESKAPALYLGYSTNVHPGENLEAVYRSLREYTLPIKQRVFGDKPSGLELRLGIGSARDLSRKRERRAFKSFLQESGLVLFSVNAYPLTDFQARRVKESVYQPSWAERARAHWTGVIARILADLLPDGVAGSISTLAGCFRPEGHGSRTFRRLAGHYLSALDVFREILERQGKSLVLAVEPEPETTFETAQDVIDFFEDHLLPLGLERWRTRFSKARIETYLRRFFTVNVDTCHLSVLFEDQTESLRRLERAGLRVGKLHVTNAVALRNPYRAPVGYQDLRGMDEPRYLHQFAGRDACGTVLWRGLDLNRLPPSLHRGRHPPVVELRSHFHVPLYLRRYRHLQTTRDETEEAVREVVRRRLASHLVIETYTWPLLAGAGNQRERLVAGISKEYRWLLGVLSSARARSRVV